jgi:NADPH-dependent 2,4-dienoyl-CoA reductase/sulfur reductase-like enzyme
VGRTSRYVIVGASLAGLSAAETLRIRGYDGQLAVVGEEHLRPYDRPPLSKQILNGEWEPEQAFLRDDADHDKLDVEWMLGQRAAGLDLDARAVILGNGETVPFDGLVVATGATPRRLPGSAGLEAMPGS